MKKLKLNTYGKINSLQYKNDLNDLIHKNIGGDHVKTLGLIFEVVSFFNPLL